MPGIKFFLKVTVAPLVNDFSTFQMGLINGGPAVLIYGLIISWIGSFALYASLAEMASMQVKFKPFWTKLR